MGMPVQLEHMDSAFGGLRPVAMDIFHLLGYVSLNMAGFRKMLKKYAKNVEPSKPQPGEGAITPLLSDETMAYADIPPAVWPVQMRAWLADESCLADGIMQDRSALPGITWSGVDDMMVWCIDGAGYLTLRVEHPHEPGWQMLQVRASPPLACSCSTVSGRPQQQR